MSDESKEATLEIKEEQKSGFLKQSLDRSNKEIRQERGEIIHEDLELAYKRKVEDLESELKRAQRKQVNAFDFSPTNTMSLVMAKELDSVEVLNKDLEMSLEIRNMTIKLNHAKARYNFLFGDTYPQTVVE